MNLKDFLVGRHYLNQDKFNPLDPVLSDTKCEGKDCMHRTKCKRFMSPEKNNQQYFINLPLKGNRCDYFKKFAGFFNKNNLGS